MIWITKIKLTNNDKINYIKLLFFFIYLLGFIDLCETT